ncbi:MAG: regulator [Sulfuricurvum sp. GWF2_44_89]|uniref:DNA-binding response regulator n=1 Tax=Sulfuricurvum kujiense TaxID=148813 RepID=A0A2D3WFT8_9BACT|nr:MULTISPECIES: response regulator transcription factor [Sulfuricurvum]OHD78498.1 MAG: regulator [Sulfuricurvum sp. GWF2_44_89]OHD91910.1 MAG: regulator [Sulfuricurvum sp. RIFOXYD12_FULL_44_77]OHD95231.1 MAG: regulator [Sulfuricurvum sp. RIFOXYD2_FULL_44_160]DAB37940.1 MAG TPA: DNA-binding response regulator [Sulfuricurvum kujiense]
MIRNMLLLKEKSVLFAEDDTITRTQMGEILEMLFAKVYVAEDGEEAYQIYEEEFPDIIITDIKMPKKDGLNLIKRVRQNNYSIPIVLMTSFAEQELLLDAANLSIDGYLVKPVELEKLTFTVCRAIQRTHKNEGLIILGKKLFYNSATKELYFNGSVVSLGMKEQELLLLLINNRHKTISKDEIGKVLWPLDPICDSAIKNIVLRLRKKLGLDIIISVRGIGYRLDTRDLPR